MHSFSVQVTPEMARQWLLEHNNYRTLRPRKVAQYAADMLSGKWQENSPQGLVFNEQGFLIDGQHRLQAQVAVNKTLSWYITQNADTDCTGRLDIGLGRSLAETMGDPSMVGTKRAQVGRLLARIEQSNNTVSYDFINSILDKIDEQPGVDQVFAHKGAPKLNAPTRAAFVYAWCVSPKIEEIWHEVLRGHVNADATIEHRKTFEVLLGAMNMRVGGDYVQRESFHKQLRCLQALVTNEALYLVKKSTLGYDYFTSRRAQLGHQLPVNGKVLIHPVKKPKLPKK